jgi:diacylglycerol kinase family enzyme
VRRWERGKTVIYIAAKATRVVIAWPSKVAFVVSGELSSQTPSTAIKF